MRINWELTPFGEVPAEFKVWFAENAGLKPIDNDWVVNGNKTVYVTKIATQDGARKGSKYFKGDRLEMDILLASKFQNDYLKAKEVISERLPRVIAIDNKNVFELMRDGKTEIVYTDKGQEFKESISITRKVNNILNNQ